MLRRPDTLSGETCAQSASSRHGTGVRAPIVAVKPGNAGGAKGGRKVEMHRTVRRKPRDQVPFWLDVTAADEALARSYSKPSPSAIQLLMASIREVVGDRNELPSSTPNTGSTLAPFCASARQPPPWGQLPTGEPDAGDSPVRFGGRGWRELLPTPIRHFSTAAHFHRRRGH